MLGSTSSMFFTAMKVLLVGYDQDRPLLIKIDTRGKVEWAKTISASGFPGLIRGITELDDQGYFLVGGQDFGSEHTQAYDLIVLKVSPQGDSLWARRYDSGGDEWAENIQKTISGRLLITGGVKQLVDKNEETSPLLMEIDKDGNPVWMKHYLTLPGQSKSNATFEAVSENANGNFFVSGSISGVVEGKADRLLALVSPEGRLTWSNRYTRNREEALYRVMFRIGDDVILLGRSLAEENKEKNEPAGVMLRVDSQGDIKDSLVIESDNYNEFTSAAQLSPDQFLLLGHTTGFGAESPNIFVFSWDPSVKQPEKTQFWKAPLEMEEKNLNMISLPNESRLIRFSDVTAYLKVRNLTITDRA